MLNSHLALLARISLVLALAGCQSARSGPEAGAGAQSASEIDALEWLVGRWVGEGFGGEVEEVWLPPAGGVMLGSFRLVSAGEPRFYEILTLGPGSDGLEMRLKHFEADLVGWEERDEVLSWSADYVEDGRARFGAVTLERRGPDGLFIDVLMSGEDGTWTEELELRRASL
ncbi:MAG: DUF6265 family protein [Planctomycetota bacterium]|jgi:hypothetical protein